MQTQHPTYWQIVWKQFRKHRLGTAALIVIFLFVLVGIYAPLLASSKPLVVEYQGSWYFPLFRYLFYPGFFTKRLDIFYNLLMFTFPFVYPRMDHLPQIPDIVGNRGPPIDPLCPFDRLPAAQPGSCPQDESENGVVKCLLAKRV